MPLISGKTETARRIRKPVSAGTVCAGQGRFFPPPREEGQVLIISEYYQKKRKLLYISLVSSGFSRWRRAVVWKQK
jgi:hypothetical protein